MRITIVGCGSIGSRLALAADEMAEVKRIYLIDIIQDKAERLAQSLKKAVVVNEIEEELYHSDLVVEAATQEAARNILPKVVARGVDVMITSVGVLVDDDFRDMIFGKAAEAESRVYIPSGAICGTDGLRSSAVGKLEEVELITIKTIESLAGSPYIVDNKIDLSAIKERTQIFSGMAKDAVRMFPRNINVAATVSLLGVGFEKTKVTIIADPGSHSNSYELRVKGEFGEISSQTYNVPSPDNPTVSNLAVMSAISALKRLVRNEWIGI